MEKSTDQQHLTMEALRAGLEAIQASPADQGELQGIVIRPKTDERVELTECDISLERGVHGDNWADGCWKTLDDGSPHPDVQIAITNARAMALIAQSRDRWCLAGDNLYVDLDLSEDNLQAGQRLAIGEAVIEITEDAHNGCGKYSRRFGPDALRFVNSKIGKSLHLRGIYARVVEPGTIRVGDVIEKV